MAYKVEITPAAQRTIKKLPKNIQRLIIAKIELLANEPRPGGVVKLSATESLYRVRTGDYRIIYEIRDKTEVGGNYKGWTSKRCLQIDVDIDWTLTLSITLFALGERSRKYISDFYHLDT